MQTTTNTYPNSEQFTTEYGSVEIGHDDKEIFWRANIGGQEHSGKQPIDDRGLQAAKKEVREFVRTYLRDAHTSLKGQPQAPDAPGQDANKDGLTGGQATADNPGDVLGV